MMTPHYPGSNETATSTASTVAAADSGDSKLEERTGLSDIGLIQSNIFDLEEGRGLLAADRPKYCSVQFTKVTVGTEIGLQVEKIEGEPAWKVANIEPSSPLANSPIQVGDRIVRVNHESFDSNSNASTSPTDFITASNGSITVVARVEQGIADRASAMVTKLNQDDKVGIVFQQHHGREEILISNIDPKGLFGQSVLSHHDRLVSVNGEEWHGGLPRDVVEMIGNSERSVTLVVQHTAAVTGGEGKVLIDPDQNDRLDRRDFWICCCLTTWIPLGWICAIPFVCYHRPNAPSNAAFRGCCTSYVVGTLLLLLIYILDSL